MSGARQVLPCSELDPGFWSLEPGLGGVQESDSILHPLSPFPEPMLLPLGHQAGRGILVLLDQTLHPILSFGIIQALADLVRMREVSRSKRGPSRMAHNPTRPPLAEVTKKPMLLPSLR